MTHTITITLKGATDEQAALIHESLLDEAKYTDSPLNWVGVQWELGPVVNEPERAASTRQEQLVVVRAELAFAMPAGGPLDAVYDTANCALIPLQRMYGGTCDLIDYAFNGAAVSETPVEPYDKDEGFKSPFPPLAEGAEDATLAALLATRNCLADWVEIAEEEDRRSADDVALAQADKLLIAAGLLDENGQPAGMPHLHCASGPQEPSHG
jgi:hypothetical protein